MSARASLSVGINREVDAPLVADLIEVDDVLLDRDPASASATDLMSVEDDEPLADRLDPSIRMSNDCHASFH